MAALNYTKSVLPVLPSTTLQASGADINLNNHILSITGCPSMDYRKINFASVGAAPVSTGNLLPSFLVETLKVYTITPTAANNADFGLQITQFVPALGRIVSEQLFTTTPSSGATATTICNAWRTQLALLADLQITGTGTSTLILTAVTRSPLFTVVAVNTGITVTETVVTGTIASSTDATPIVVTTDAKTYVVGQSVTISGHTTNTNANGTWRVAATNGTTTLELQGSTATGGGAGGATGTAVINAQASKGNYLDLIAAGVDASLISASNTYNQMTFNYDQQDPALTIGDRNSTTNQHTIYVNSAATNFANFNARMNQAMAAYTSTSGTTFDVNTVSLV